MKHAFSLILCLCLSLTALPAQEILKQAVSLSLHDTPLEKALFMLMDDYSVPLSFSNDILPDKHFTLQIRNRPLVAVLDLLLRDTKVSYRQVGRQIVLFPVNYRVPPASERHTISGFITDAKTGERLILASVLDRNSGQGTLTNEYGFFSLSLEAGEVSLQFSYLGFQPQERAFLLQEDRSLAIALHSDLMLQEVVVVAEDSILDGNKSGYSIELIDISDVLDMPALAGEADIIRMTHLLPGVQTGADGIGGIFVRGGDAGHNLVMIDGVPVYNISHAAGLFSILNSQAIRSARLVKGGFPARYGGRLASVLDIRTKEGNVKSFSGQAEVGMLTARLALEGPIIPNKSSFFLSGRRSFLNWFLKPVSRRFKAANGETGNTAYDFYDLNGKVNYTFSDRDKVYLSFYAGNDRFRNAGFGSQTFRILEDGGGRDTLDFRLDHRYTEDYDWGNHTAAARWNHIFNPRMFANLTLTYSRLKVNFGYNNTDSVQLVSPQTLLTRNLDYGQYRSSIQDFGGRVDFEAIPLPKHYVRFGAGISHHRFQPGLLRFTEQTEELAVGSQIGNEPIQSLEYHLYAEDDISVNPYFNLNVGLRLASLMVESQAYFSVEPRFSFFWKTGPQFAVKGSMSHNSQFLHLLSSSGIGLPTDLWVPSTDKVKPQVARQWTLGLERKLPSGMHFSLEGYYKKMENLVTFAEGANFLNEWQKNITAGEGKAYGLETSLRKSWGRTTGWIAYTLAWAERRFDLVNQGNPYPFRYDRRHDFKIVLQQKVLPWLDISANWLFSSGLAFTAPVQKYEVSVPGLPYQRVVALDYGAKNQFRMPAYHRLDLGMTAAFKTRGLAHTLGAGVYNAYNRKNPVYYDLRMQLVNENFQLREKPEYVQVWLIPVMPYLNYSIKF